MNKRICIKPTIKCNYNCPTCHERRELYNIINNNKELTYDNWIDILKQASDIGYYELTISGGEPLIYNRIVNMIKDANNIGYKRISINTNASLLNKNMSDKLFDSGLTNICISLTDFDNNSYMKSKGITNSKILSNVINNISYFNNNKPYTIHSNNIIFLTTNNLFKLSMILKRSELLNFDSVGIDLLEGNFDDDTYRLTKEDVQLFINKYLASIKDNYRDKIRNLLQILLKDNYKDISNLNCDIPGNFCIILPNGDLHPCNIHEYSHEPIINLFDYNLDFNKAMTSDFINNFKVNKSKYCDRCQMNLGIDINL